MPYKSKDKDREWHRDTMRQRRSVAKRQLVTPKSYTLDADGQPIYEEE